MAHEGTPLVRSETTDSDRTEQRRPAATRRGRRECQPEIKGWWSKRPGSDPRRSARLARFARAPQSGERRLRDGPVAGGCEARIVRRFGGAEGRRALTEETLETARGVLELNALDVERRRGVAGRAAELIGGRESG